MFISLLSGFILAQIAVEFRGDDAGTLDSGFSLAQQRKEAAQPTSVETDSGSANAGITADAGTSFAAEGPVDAGVVTFSVPKNFTGVVGRVVDAATGEGLIEASVKVVSGAKKSSLTDLEGNFKLKLPPGNYSLRVFSELYQARRIDNVVVKQGTATRIEVQLSNEAQSVQEVVVEAKADKRSEASLLQERKRSAVVVDAVGAQEMARTPDSNASDAVKRVMSATVVDGRYVFLRGLGGRYVQTLLNGTVMPSPEPDEPSVPLDMFPVALISNMSVAKTYSPQMPGSFGGGALTLETPSFPSSFELKVKLNFQGDTQNTFRMRPNAPLSGVETLGFADPGGGIPKEVPQDRPLTRTLPAEQVEAAGRAFKNDWTPKFARGLPSATLAIEMGDRVKIPKTSASFGYLAAIQWARRERARVIKTFDIPSKGLGEFAAYSPNTTRVGFTEGGLSALLAAGIESQTFDATYTGLFLSNFETGTSVSDGIDADSAPTTSSRLTAVQRQLFFNQLRGHYRFSSLSKLELDWQVNYSRVNREEPDIRDLRSWVDDSGRASIRLQPNSGERFFLSLGEDAGGGSAEFTKGFRNISVKLGGSGQYNQRLFDGRRFRLRDLQNPPLSSSELLLPPDQLFAEQNIGPASEGTRLLVTETTFSYDRYRASLAVWAAYAVADWKPTQWLRVYAGARYEGSTQTLEGGTPFSTQGARVDGTARRNHDAVPSLNLVWSPRDNLNVRLGYAYTLARPTFRELAPFLFFDMMRRRNVTGDAELAQTRIHHADARVEWFMNEQDILAASAFGKQFVQPIERVIVTAGSSPDLGYQNVPSATLVGLELEARKQIRDFRVGANVSLVYSQVKINADGKAGLQTNNRRPLQGQSPYVANAYVSYHLPRWGTELGLFYNVYGPRITEVGAQELPDVYEQPFHRLDLTLMQPLPGGFSFKASASNLFNQSVRYVQGPLQIYQMWPGLQVSAALSWSFQPKK